MKKAIYYFLLLIRIGHLFPLSRVSRRSIDKTVEPLNCFGWQLCVRNIDDGELGLDVVYLGQIREVSEKTFRSNINTNRTNIILCGMTLKLKESMSWPTVGAHLGSKVLQGEDFSPLF